MTCPSCGAEVPTGASLCPKCSLNVTVAPVLSSPDPQPARPEQRKQSGWAVRTGAWLLSAVCWYLVFTLSLTTTLRRYGSFTAEAYGYFFGYCAMAFVVPLIGTTLYFRKRVPRPPVHRRALVVSGLGVLFSVLAHSGNNSLSVALPAERVAVLAKEGAGILPASRDESIWDGAARSFFKDITEFNRRYVAEAGALDQSALAGLYSAESFRDRAQMEKILSQLRAAEAVDEKYGSLEPLLERMRARVRAVDAPDGTKEEFLKGFTSSTNEGLARRTELTAKEKAWVQASIDLYESAMAAKPSYYIRNGKLIFQSAEAVAEFDGKMKKAQDLRGEFLSAKAN